MQLLEVGTLTWLWTHKKIFTPRTRSNKFYIWDELYKWRFHYSPWKWAGWNEGCHHVFLFLRLLIGWNFWTTPLTPSWAHWNQLIHPGFVLRWIWQKPFYQQTCLDKELTWQLEWKMITSASTTYGTLLPLVATATPHSSNSATHSSLLVSLCL